MLGVDSVNQQVRPNLLYVEGGGAAFKVAPEQGKALNLREGQIINGIITSRPEGNVLNFGKNYLLLPNAFAASGGSIQLEVAVIGGSFVLRKVNLEQQTKRQSLSNTLIVAEENSARLERLLTFSQFKGINSLPMNSLLESLTGNRELEEIREILLSRLSPVREISGRQIREMLLATGLFLENGLAKGNPGNVFSLKSLLMKLRNSFLKLGRDSSFLVRAIDDLESLQLETLALQLNGQNGLAWALPFTDEPPVVFKLLENKDGQDRKNENSKREWHADIELDMGSSFFSIRCALSSEGLSLICWVPDPELYQFAMDNKNILEARLRDMGVEMLSMAIHHTARIQHSEEDDRSRSFVKFDV